MTASDAPDPTLLQGPLPAAVIKRLLDRLNVPAQAGALANACEKSQREHVTATPAERIRQIFRSLELGRVQVAQLGWTRFDQRRLPALMFREQKWQLVERATDGTFRLTDEDGHARAWDEESLGDGTVLWLHMAPRRDTSSARFTLEGNRAAQLVLGEVFKSRRWVREVVIATVIVNVIAVATSIFAMQVYDRVVPTLAYATLWTLVAGMGIVVCLDWLLKIVRARTLDSVSSAVDRAVSQQVFDHVMRLRLDTRPRSLGTLAAQVGGLDSVRQFFTSGVVFGLVDMPFALMFIAFIAMVGGQVAWAYLGLLPVAVALGLATQKRLRRLVGEQMSRSNERSGLLVDAISGVESVRTNNASWRFSEQWKEVTAEMARYQVQQRAIANRTTVTTGSLATVAYVSAVVIGVGQIEAGNITMGAMIACSILGGRVIAPVSNGIQYLTQWQNVSQSLALVNRLLTLETERRPEQNLLMPDVAPDRVVLEGVRFCYPGSPTRQLNIAQLCFQAGDRVALLGPVGCGKSTLLKVLAGLYRPSEGRVLLGNADLWEIDPDLVAQHVGYLPQSVHLFKGTLHSNLALSGAVGDSQLLDVSKALGIDRIAAESSLGMELAISEGGEGLSGGQRQLVGLGRVLLARPKIWLLDEPTASLDADSERQVLQAIQAHIGADDILLLSTHRPGLATELVNRVIMMRHGEVVGDGAPETLIPRAMGRQSDRAATGPKRARPRGPRDFPPGDPKGAPAGVV